MKKFLHPLLLACMFMCFLHTSYAQLNYQPGGFSTFIGTYTDLGTNGDTIVMNNIDNGHSAALPIGFTFRFNGIDYDSLRVYVDGFIKLGRDSASSNLLYTTFVQPPAGGPFSSTFTQDTSLIVPFGQDLWNRGGAQNSEFRIYTDGVFGMRVCTIQWKNVSDKLQNGVDTQFDTINFQLKLYEGVNWIEFVYGRWVSSPNLSNARFAACGLKGNSTLANQLLTVTKGSAVGWGSLILNQGNYINNALNYGNNVGVARPLPENGRTFRFTPLVLNDVAVSNIYAIGKVALGAYTPDSIRVRITNPGVNPQGMVPITLTVSGANTYTQTVFLSSIAANGSAIVSFDPYMPINYGTNVITVTVPADDNPTNNSREYGFSVSERHFAYTDTLAPLTQAWGSVAFTAWGARYFITGSRRITSVRSFLFVNSDALGDTICAMILDTLGNVLGRSPSYVVQPADLGTWLQFSISNPPTVTNQSIIAAMANGQQTSNLFLGTVQSEDPIRPANTFFYQITNNTGNNITNLTAGQPFGIPAVTALGRLVMECTADELPPNDVGISQVFPRNNTTIPTGTRVPLTALVRNWGTSAQTAGVEVRYRINNGPIVGPVSTTALLPTADTTSVIFSGLNGLQFATPGTYTVQVWTTLAADTFRFNDTLTLTYQVQASGLGLPYRVSTNLLTSGWVPLLNPSNIIQQDIAVHPNGVSTAGSLFFNNGASLGRALLQSPVLNIAGARNPVLNFHVAHAPNTMSIHDTLRVLISRDGGYTYDTVYQKVSNTTAPRLGTVAPQATLFIPNAATQWRLELVNLESYKSDTALIIAFQSSSGGSNRVYITNVNVTSADTLETFNVLSSGSFSSDALMLNLTNMGAMGTTLGIATYRNFPVSIASPVYATNTTATVSTLGIFTPNNVSNRYWSIHYDGIGTGNLPPTVEYTINIDLTTIQGVINPDSIYVMRRSDHRASWVPVNTLVAANSIQTATLTGFGEFALGSLNSVNTLPVKLLNFSAKLQSTDAELNWQTMQEVNNSGFEILRSVNNGPFESIGFVRGVGNSNSIQHYRFLDQGVYGNTCYMLKQIDFNGTYSLSDIRCVSLKPDIGVLVTPNPFNSHLNINLNFSGVAHITITDINGRECKQLELNTEAGVPIAIPTVDLAKGAYIIQIVTPESSYQYKLVK